MVDSMTGSPFRASMMKSQMGPQMMAGAFGPSRAAPGPAMMMRDDDAAGTSTGDSDRDFAMQMVPHHQEAIEMAQAELQGGIDPQLRKMAEKIIAAQQKEIAELQEWLMREQK